MEEGPNTENEIQKEWKNNREYTNQKQKKVTTTEKWLETVKAGGELTLSPFSGTNNSEQKDEGDSLSLQDELLVDISGIRPAGHDKSLFSIDEDSQEGSPSKSTFQLVDLTDSESLSMPTSPQDSDPGGGGGGGFKFNQGVAGVTFDPTSPSATLSPLSRPRRDSIGSTSTMSDVSALFPIYEVPGVSFTMPQSDLESSSEWEDGSSSAVDRLSKDTVYQAYLKMRQRYHKYKGRYADLARAYKEKEKESEKLRDVLTKTQDKGLRKVSELREQCSLEQQAKAHLEQELRSDLEERDHKISALNTKVKILQEGLGSEVLNAARQNGETENQVQTHTEGTQTPVEDHKPEENGRIPSIDEGDNVSVASQCSTMTNMEQDEIIEKLKAIMEDEDENIISDVVKHKSLLARCMENIRSNKEKITSLTTERDLATQQLQDKIKQIDLLKEENEKELEGLRFNVESSALSMAETKKQLFEELQNKEAMADCFKKQAEEAESSAAEHEEKWNEERSNWEEEEQRWKEERSKWEQDLQTKQTAIEDKERSIEELNRELRIAKESSTKDNSSMDTIKEEIQQLEARTKDLKEGRTKLKLQVEELDALKIQLEKKVAILEEEKGEQGKKYIALETKTNEDQEAIALLNKQNEYLKENQSNITSANKDLEHDKNELLEKLKTFENSQRGAQQKLNGLESSTSQMAKEMAQLQESNQQMDNKVKQLERKKKEFENQLGEEESRREELENQLQEVENKKQASQDQIEKSGKEIIALSQEVQELREVNKKLKESIEKVEGEKQDLEKTLYSSQDQSTKENQEKTIIQKELVSFKTEKESLQGQLDENKSQVEELNEKIRDHIAEIDNLKMSKNTLLTELERKNAEIITIKDSIEKLKIEKDEVLQNFEEYRIENEKINQQLKSLHSECENLKEDKNRLNSEMSAAKACHNNVNKQAMEELNKTSSKMDELNDNWSKQMKEKDVINENLVKKVTELENSLKKKNDDHKNEITKLNENLKSIGEEKNQYINKIGMLEEAVTSRSKEIEKLQQNSTKSISELTIQVSELEGIIKAKDIELKEALEEKQKLDKFKEVVIQEKSKMQNEFETLKSEIRRLQEESESNNKEIESKNQLISSLKIIQDTLNQNNKKMSEDHKDNINKLNEDHKQKYEKLTADHKLNIEKRDEEIKSKDEDKEKLNKRLAELELEIKNNSSQTKDKDTQLADLQNQLIEKEKLYTDLQNKTKEKYKAFLELKNRMQEKEKTNKEVQALLHEKEKELSDTKNTLHSTNETLTSLQVAITQKEEKVENILKEKKAVFDEYSIKVGELEGELTKKEQQLQETLKERETQVEYLEEQLKEKETCSAEKIESCLQLQHSLEQKLKDTEHKVLEKDQMMVRQKEENKQTEDQWQQRLRCEVEKVQKQHEDQLALVRSELSKSQQCELETLRDSHTRALQERDATIAALKDQVDQLTSNNEDSQATTTTLQTQVADTQQKLKCQSERVEELEAALEQQHTKMAEVESQMVLAAAQQMSPQFACDDPQQMETLVQQNKELTDKLRHYENENQMVKTIAMLEFNNEHNKQKLSSEETSRAEVSAVSDVDPASSSSSLNSQNSQQNMVINMELSHKALVEKYSGIESENADLERQLREGSKEIIDKITAEAEATTQKFEAEKEELIQQLTKENEELQERLSRETEELRAQYEDKQKHLTDQVDGLTEIKQSFEKQIKQIEKNNEEMHANIGVVQLHRNEARAESAQLKKEGEVLKEELTKLGEAKASLEQELQELKDANIDLKEKLSGESAQVSNMGESIKTLENNILNLQKQVEALKETNVQLTDNMHLAQKAKADIEKKNVEERNQYTEKLSALEDQLTKTKEELSTKGTSVEQMEAPVVEAAITQQASHTVHSAAPPTGTSDELTATKNLLQTTQEKLRLAEMLNSEVDEYREKIRSLESKMAAMEDNYRQQMHNMSLENQQDSETHSLIKTHQTTLQENQQQVKEKTDELDIARKEYTAKLQDKDEELTKFIHQYEDQIASLQSQHESHMKQVEATWRARAEKMVKQREGQLQEEMDGLSEEWNKERKELERLTQVAAAAFRSGSDSVELLKKQVSAQRRELDEVKSSHKSEMDELKRLLELKQRSRRGVGGGVKMGCVLEEAAEFEYLRNILYQYMMGKETQTLSKVLCAVVKFNSEQQAEILEREDQRQNLLSAQNSNFPHSNGIDSNGTVPHEHFMTYNDSKTL